MALHETMWLERARTIFLYVLAVVAVSIGVLLAAEPAHADTTFFVNSAKDRVDVRPGNGTCYTGVGIVHDDGGIERECTLRAAIQEANAFPGADAINFGIPSTEDSNCVATTNVCTISPASQLPTITRPLNIRGYSQPEASANTATIGTNAELKIVLNGSRIESSADGLLVTARNTSVRGS